MEDSENVKVRKVEPEPFALVTYEVVRDGKVIGTVSQHEEYKRPKPGRITRPAGTVRRWHADPKGSRSRSSLYSKRDAVKIVATFALR